MSESPVRAFYSGKSIFITGGSGFVGVCLVEKILRTVPDVGRVYLLLRPKRGKDAHQRLEDLTKNKIFETLLQTVSSDVFNKLIPIAGDLAEEALGISPQDRRTLIENVDVVIHSGATLDFEEDLRTTVTINLLGTRRVIDLCKQCKKLKVFVHVSSAFANSFLPETHEYLYPPPADADDVVALLGELDDAALAKLQPKLIGKHYNTYTFTKHLAEHEVKRCSDLFPCTIVRPTMIVGAWKEPVPGWTISKVGPQGFIMGASNGVIRRMPVSLTNIKDFIPVDTVVNQLLVAGYNTATTRPGLTVYHASTSSSRPFTWGMVDYNAFLQKYPIKGAIWYPYIKLQSSLFMFRLSAIFVHFLPAYFLDMVLRLTGGKPTLVHLHTIVWHSITRLHVFLNAEWIFHNPNTRDLSSSLNDVDKKLFYFDISTLKWDDYFDKLTLGVRRYLTREEIKTLPAARRKNTMLFGLHILLQVAVVAGLWWCVATVLGSTMYETLWAAPVVYLLFSLL